MANARWLMAALFAGTLALNTWGGLSDYPPNSDETSSGLQVRLMGWKDWRAYLLPPHKGIHETTAEAIVQVGQWLWGSTVEAGRLTQAALGALLVVGTYGFARHVFGDPIALYAALFLMVNHVRIHLSRVWLTGSLQGAACMVLALWAVASIGQHDRWTHWLPRSIVAGLLVGFGMQNYRLAHAMPVLVPATVVLWRARFPVPWWLIAGLVTAVTLVIGLPWMLWHLRDQSEFHHVGGLLANWPLVQEHLWKCLTIWWTGGDQQQNYGAALPVFDLVAGMAFAAGLMALPRSPALFALALLWLPLLMLGALGLVNNDDGGGVSYYRLPMPLVFACLIAGWGLAAGHSARFPHLSTAIAVLVLSLSAYQNVHFYFVTYQTNMRPDEGWLAVRRLCANAGTPADVALVTNAEQEFQQRRLYLECPAVACALLDHSTFDWSVWCKT